MDQIAAASFSLTLSGNSGISPFLTMLLIGITEWLHPEQFNMSETMHKIMASWPSIVIWSSLTILEYVAKCVPVLDEIMDSIDVFLVPILSVLGSMSSFGTGSTTTTSSSANNSNDNATGGDDSENTNNENEANPPNFTTDEPSITLSSTPASGLLTFVRVILILIGILLSLSLHFLKMLLRLLGMGCLTQCLTILEFTTVMIGVLVSIFIREFAIFVACCLILASGYHGWKRWKRRQEKRREEESAAVGTGQGQNSQQGSRQGKGSQQGSRRQKQQQGGGETEPLTADYERMEDAIIVEPSAPPKN